MAAPPVATFPRDAPEHQLFRAPRFREQLARALVVTGAALARSRRPVVAVSGGKDSTVVMALALSLRPDCALHWSDDELEYPETVAYMTMLNDLAGDQLRITLGRAVHAGWFRPWSRVPPWREPLPGSLTITCSAEAWAGHEGYDLTFTGLRASESERRARHLARRGMLYRIATGTGARCSPIADWTEDDVWALIAGWGLPYNAAYDRLRDAGIARERQRVGPLPLTPRSSLAAGWPDLLGRLEARYGPRWEG